MNPLFWLYTYFPFHQVHDPRQARPRQLRLVRLEGEGKDLRQIDDLSKERVERLVGPTVTTERTVLLIGGRSPLRLLPRRLPLSEGVVEGPLHAHSCGLGVALWTGTEKEGYGQSDLSGGGTETEPGASPATSEAVVKRGPLQKETRNYNSRGEKTRLFVRYTLVSSPLDESSTLVPRDLDNNKNEDLSSKPQMLLILHNPLYKV